MMTVVTNTLTTKSLPNELLMRILDYIPSSRLSVFLLVCRYTNRLVTGKVYRKAIFPDALCLADIMNFCQRHGSSLGTIKLPQGKRYSDTFFMLLFQLCPNLNFLQSSMTPKQLQRLLLRTHYPLTCFMMTQHTPSSTQHDNSNKDQYRHNHPIQSYQHQRQFRRCDGLLELIRMTQDYYNVTRLTCCSSIFLFPNHPIPDTTLTHISHYFHHPGALRNAILPTFGPDLLSLTLNMYDILTVHVAQLIAAKCPRLRYLHVPQIKAEGLWMLLHKCNTLVTIVVGGSGRIRHHHRFSMTGDNDEGGEEAQEMVVTLTADNDENDNDVDNEDDDDIDDEMTSNIEWINQENKKAVATVETHKRVWCIHRQHEHSPRSRRLSWHIGILPKR